MSASGLTLDRVRFWRHPVARALRAGPRGRLPVLSKALAYAANALWAFPALLLMRALRPWILFRVGPLRCERVGHFVLDGALYLAQRRRLSQRRKTIDLIFFPEAPVNAQWARMVRRTFIVGWWVRYLVSFNRRIPGGAVHEIDPTNHSRDVRGLLPDGSGRIAFLAEEDAQAKQWLSKRGWREGEPFVCLLVRDAAYLSSHDMHAHEDWSYHDYRDSDIDNFGEAMQALLDKGYWVIRMGQVMQKRFPISHPRLIDYPFVDDQDDLLDIWLSAHCAFFVSTGTGIDTVPVVYGRPIVFVNFNPFGNILSYADNVCVPKHLVSEATGERLTLREHCSAHFTYMHEYDSAGIALRELTPDEITAAVVEGEQRYAGTWLENEDDRERQRRFWQALSRWERYSEQHGVLHPRARVGRDWLQSMGDAFLE